MGAFLLVPLVVAVIAVSGGTVPRQAAQDGLRANGFPLVGAKVFSDEGRGGAQAKWGSVDCQARERVFTKPGGRPDSGADGGRPRPGVFRKLRVLDGDDIFGERCELGQNNRFEGPTVLYEGGTRRITFMSLRLGENFPLDRARWQVVMQMKETQPYDGGGRSPIINLEVFDHEWRLLIEGRQVWSAPAEADRWTRFAFDVAYSDDPRAGSIQVFVDRNGDGDARDGRERSRTIRTATLRSEGPGTSEDGLEDGDAIPAHLRVGIYHDPAYGCHAYRCSLGVDDVRVHEPHG
jgi:hypothetical protein